MTTYAYIALQATNSDARRQRGFVDTRCVINHCKPFRILRVEVAAFLAPRFLLGGTVSCSSTT